MDDMAPIAVLAKVAAFHLVNMLEYEQFYGQVDGYHAPGDDSKTPEEFYRQSFSPTVRRKRSKERGQ